MSPPSATFEALVFQLGEELAAFPLAAVQEVVPIATTVELPESPAWVVGVMDVRGELVPVLDVWSRIHQRERALELSDQVIVCESGTRRVGLLVQDVHQVQTIVPERLIADPGSVEAAAYLLGAYPAAEGSLLVLDVDRLVQRSDLPEEPEA
ncbi:MAG: chemotaxis protein CheW [Deltaproteobacteria bacterium]|nr:chemotaxis protein CheW [Deltaproteobacteria bacterium]